MMRGAIIITTVVIAAFSSVTLGQSQTGGSLISCQLNADALSGIIDKRVEMALADYLNVTALNKTVEDKINKSLANQPSKHLVMIF